MNYKSKKTKNGQVLLITLLVLTIIGIVVVGLITLSNRDVNQVVTSEKYETLYNNAETEVRKLIDNFGSYSKTLDSSLTNSFPDCTEVQSGVQYSCNITNSTQGSTDFKTNITITNKKDVTDFEVQKDRSLDLIINGYNGGVDFTWDRAAAVEFTIIAQDTGNKSLKVIKDVYDMSGVYDGLIGDDPYTASANHSISYQVIDASNKPKSTRVTLSSGSIKGLSASDYVYTLIVTPRMKDSNGSVKFNIVAQNPNSFPYQIREFISSSIDNNDSASPVAKVITQIPLAPQLDSVFGYSFITDSELSSY